MAKLKNKKSGFHLVHLLAAFVLGGYFVTSKIHLVWSLQDSSIIYSFLKIYSFGVFFAIFFLYIFSHDKFFSFAREIEKKQKQKEEKYLKKYLHHGKVLATFLIGILGGPVFSSLTARILLNNFWYKYLIVVLANIPSTVITVGLSKGIINFF